MIKKNIFNVFSLIILSVTFFCFYGSWIVESDSLHYHLLSLDNSFLSLVNDFISVSLSQGRAALIGSFWYKLTFMFDNYIYFKSVFYILVFLNALFLSLILSKIFKNSYVKYLVFAIFLSFLQNTWHANGLLGFSNMFTGMITLFLLSVLLFICFLENNKKILLYISVFLYLLSLFTYEVFLIYLPIYIFISFLYKKDFRKIFFSIFPFLIAVFIYLLTYFLVKKLMVTGYVGATLNSDVNIKNIFHVLFQFSISSIPLYMLRFDTWSRSFGVFNILLNDKYLFLYLILFLVKAISISSIIYIFLKTFYKKIIISKYILVVSLFYFIFSPLLLSLTQHYQSIVVNKIFLSEPITYFSYFFLIVFVVSIMIFINNIIYIKKYHNFYVLFICTVIFFISIIMDYSNLSYSKSQFIARNKWTYVDNLIKQGYFNNIENNSTLYTTNFLDNLGTLQVIEDNYWSKYIYKKTGKYIHIIDLIETSELGKYYIKTN